MEAFVKDNTEELLKVWLELCKIPAPSHSEEHRAEYCKSVLESFGAKNVYVDGAKNVIYPLNCEASNEITVIAAHTDTVFPDTEPFTPVEKDGRVYCPGAGDDTASVAVILFIAKYFIENGINPPRGILFVLNSCEEGLGNLKGTKELFNQYGGRIKEFVSFDCAQIGHCYNACIGSHRYRVTAKTPGGHSFGNFGVQNAIAVLSKIVKEIYDIEVPSDGTAKTTYNVGTISGGTSVNTIAQYAEILCEYRSERNDYLEIMQSKFNEIFEKYNTGSVSVTVKKVGDRPCGRPEDTVINEYLCDCYKRAVSGIVSGEIDAAVASTDCNVPLSLSIPAIAIGVFNGKGAHTKEEYVEKSSVPVGLTVGLRFTLDLTSK